MTKEEMDNLAAECVMGWPPEEHMHYDFTPSANWDHAGMILDRMRELGWKVGFSDMHNTAGETHVWFRKGVSRGRAFDPIAQSAITFAAVNAVRGEVPNE